jgi:hypothetical protein
MRQRKVSNGVAQLAAAGSSLERHEIAAIPAISAMRRDDNAGARTPAEILARGPSCVSLTPQLKRE